MKNIHTIIDIILGISVLFSYSHFLVKKWNFTGSYKEHPLWFNLNKNSIQMIIIFQLCAMISFLIIYHHIFLSDKIKEGILFYDLFGTKFKNILIKIYFICSFLWSVFVFYGHNKNSIMYKTFSVICLVMVAICNILMIAGVFENNSSLLFILCSLILGIVHVLIDGIGWNAVYIKNSL